MPQDRASDNFTCRHTRDRAGRPWLLSQPVTDIILIRPKFGETKIKYSLNTTVKIKISQNLVSPHEATLFYGTCIIIYSRKP